MFDVIRIFVYESEYRYWRYSLVNILLIHNNHNISTKPSLTSQPENNIHSKSTKKQFYESNKKQNRLVLNMNLLGETTCSLRISYTHTSSKEFVTLMTPRHIINLGIERKRRGSTVDNHLLKVTSVQEIQSF